jgi:hypothetical protein
MRDGSSRLATPACVSQDGGTVFALTPLPLKADLRDWQLDHHMPVLAVPLQIQASLSIGTARARPVLRGEAARGADVAVLQ